VGNLQIWIPLATANHSEPSISWWPTGLRNEPLVKAEAAEGGGR